MKKISTIFILISFCNTFSQDVNKNLSLAEKFASEAKSSKYILSRTKNKKQIEELKLTIPKNIKQALEFYNSAIIEDTTDCAYLFYKRALFKENINDLKGAIEDYYSTINKNHDCEIIWSSDGTNKSDTYGFNYVSNSEVYGYIARLRIDSNDYIGAVEDFSSAIEANDDNRIDYYYKARGEIKNHLGDFRGAIKDFEYLLSKNENDYEILELIGDTKFDMKDENGAIEYYTKTIKINNKKGIIFYNRGLCFLNLNKIDEACIDFSRAGELGYKEAYEKIKTSCK